MNNLYKLRCLDFVEKDEDIWFPNLNFNALIKINKESGKIQIIDKFPNYKVQEGWLYIAVYMFEQKLVFVPNSSREIVSYDMKTGKFISVPLNLDIVGRMGGYFLSAYAYKNFVYMFPAWTKYIVRFDVVNNAITYLDLGLSIALKRLPEVSVCFIKEFEIIGHKIYIPFAMLNAIAIFDLEREQLEIKYLNIIGGCSTIKYLEGCFYLASTKENKIYRWNEKKNEIIIYDDFPLEFISKNYVFSCSYFIANKIFFMPLESNMITSLNLQTGEVGCERKIVNVNREPWNTYFVKRENDKIISMTADTSKLCLLEYENEKLRYIPYYNHNDAFIERKINDFLVKKKSFYLREENKESLEKYILYLKNSNISIEDNETKKYGKFIYEQIIIAKNLKV